MNTSRTLLIGAALCAMLAQSAFAAPHTPRKGSAERTAILNVLHKNLGSGKHKPLVTANNFNVEGGWAYITGYFNYADGAPLEEEYQNGPGSTFQILLHREGGRWRVKRNESAGDVEEPSFMREFPQAPRGIFKVKIN